MTTPVAHPAPYGVRLRNLWGEDSPAEVLPLNVGVAVVVPGLGHVVIAMSPDGWRALFTQGPGKEHEREVRADGDDLIVDVLVNHDRRGVQVVFTDPATVAAASAAGVRERSGGPA